LEVEGDPDCPVHGNIVLRAAALLRTTAVDAPPAVTLRLTKRIPVAAGLGGGSSDAAAVLRLLAGEWGLPLGDAESLDLAAQLGSDVPFFVAGCGAALMSGRGERLEPLPAVGEAVGVLLVTPLERLRTADVFAEHAREPAPSSEPLTDELVTAFAAEPSLATLLDLAGRARDANDLWPAAVRIQPALGRIRADVEACLSRPVLLSGSGPTLFAVYPSRAAAVEAAEMLHAEAVVAPTTTVIATDLTDPIPAWRTP
jgi:4-diphosphocytidyl-2-C-methyl-D-erythritol kinase